MAEPVVIKCQSLYKVFGVKKQDIETNSEGIIDNSLLTQKGAVAAVNNVTLDVHKGELLVVMGLSGSGKSTLVRCMSRLIEPSSGLVEIEGKNIIEKFFNLIAILWMDTPAGIVLSIALVVLFALIINGGSMDNGAPSFFTSTE